MIMAGAVINPENIIITLSNGDIADITQIYTLPYLTHIYKYTYKLGGLDVSSDTLELIQGATLLCVLFGFDPSSLATNIKYNGHPINYDFGKYFGQLSIYNFTQYPDGSTIHIDYTKKILQSTLVDSMKKSFGECFPETTIGIIVPSEIYMMSSTANRNDSIALAFISPTTPDSINVHKNLEAYYIYNVCSNIDYRGQGLAKSIMITMLNNLYSQGQTRFILEVLNTNTVAYNLYTGLGFRKISSTLEEDKTYDVLYLQM
jgi:hypothetical protein